MAESRDDVQSEGTGSHNTSMERPPVLPPDSPGSSVSTRLQEEYDELLKYAVVVPDYNPKDVNGKLTDTRGLFGRHDDIVIVRTANQQSGLLWDLEREAHREELEEGESEGERTPRTREEQGREGVEQLPDFGESPIGSHGPASFTHPRRSDTSGLADGGSNPRDDAHRVSSDRLFNTSEPIETVYTATIDQDVGRMETMLDHWCLELKRNVLAEFSQAKIVIEQKSHQELVRERSRHCKEKEDLIKELDSLKEFLLTYEQSMKRKDAIIANLTQAMYRQRDKQKLLRNFCQWRAHHNDVKREAFTLKMAKSHHERVLKRRVLYGWFSLIHGKWRSRVEKACQNKAQEICMQVTADYETKIASLNEAQESSREEIRRMQVQRERYEEAMKKAFMRGVCALNMEAMSMFHGEDADGEQTAQGREELDRNQNFSHNLYAHVPDKGPPSAKAIPQETLRSSIPVDDLPPKIVTSQGSRSAAASSAPPRQTSAKSSSSVSAAHKPRVVTAKVTAKGLDSGRTGPRCVSPSLHAPMASVIVERHQPVNKETLGQATASRFSRSTAETDKFRQIAGQQGKAPPVRTVRVVD